MYPSRQTFLVLGLSRSGKAATEFLRSEKAEVYVYDDNSSERTLSIANELSEKGAKIVMKEELSKATEVCDVLVISPGIPIDHPLAVSFKRRGKAVVGETELAARRIKSPVIAVTGTNGKTTTVSMLREVLEKGGYKAIACGNIGTPMLEICEEEGIDGIVSGWFDFVQPYYQRLCERTGLPCYGTREHFEILTRKKDFKEC